MGNLDPSRTIVIETNRIPFKHSNMHSNIWDKKTSIRNWPSIIPGWRNWLIKVVAKKRTYWVLRNLDQCISLSLCDIKKNESMLKVLFFWSNTYNVFLFRQGPMSPSLADVHMVTCLNIRGHINPFNLLVKPSFKLESIRTRGWPQYIISHKSNSRSVSHREHTTFLNMWLDRYVFCGKACSGTSNFLTLAEKISRNLEIPLGKIVLGALYSLLNRVSHYLMQNETVPTITGP
jgi:hypothetical protein